MHPIKKHAKNVIEFKEIYEAILKLIAKTYKNTNLKMYFIDL